jgi:glycosyltransferase involved in cell wall biosynthesis
VKIGQVIARFNRGGTATWLNELILNLRKQNITVDLLAGTVQNGETEDESFALLGGKKISGLGRSIAMSDDFRAILQIRKELKSANFNLINTHTAKAGALGRIAALSLGKNRPAIVHTFHGHLLYGYFRKPKLFVFKVIEKFLASKSDVIIAAGDLVKKELLASGIGKQEQYIVARPGIHINGLEDKATARQSLGIHEGVLVVGWLGRLTQIKRPDRVIELAREFREFVFVIGGDGQLLEELRFNIPENVILLGWTRPELIWAISDIALLTSENEAQPISLIEAGLAGLPAIAENVGSVSEVIKNNVTGILVSNLKERIDALTELSKSQALRIKMGVAGQKYCEEKFGPQQFLNSHLKAYEIAIQRRNSKI